MPYLHIVGVTTFSVFLDMMGMSLVQPILPFYAEKFDASASELGALYSSYAAMAFIATFGMGKASDAFGRKSMVHIHSLAVFLYHTVIMNS